MAPYHNLMELTIQEARKGGIGLDDLMTDLFETMLRTEREVFLREESTEENKGNGYYTRSMPSFHGKLSLRVPRDRLGHFQPMMLEMVRKQSATCAELALSLYAKGLSTRMVEEVVETCFGEKMSSSKVSALAQSIQPVRERWQQRPLQQEYFALMIDALRLHVRRDTVDHEACFLVLGILPSGRREILGMYLFPEEGAYAWREVFRDLQNRGCIRTHLLISDELTGIREAVQELYPAARHQLCLVHRLRSLVNHVRADRKQELVSDFQAVFALDDPANTVEMIEKRLESFLCKWERHIPGLRKKLDPEKLSHYAAFVHFPLQVRRMLYTTNWIERLNRTIRKVTNRVGVFPTPDSLQNLVYLALEHAHKNLSRHIPAFTLHVLPHYTPIS